MTKPATYADLGLPKRHEDWRWSNLKAIEAALDASPRLAANDAAPDLSDYMIPDHDGPVLIFVDGRYVEQGSTPGHVKTEVEAHAPERGPLGALAAKHRAVRVVAKLGKRLHILHFASGGQAHLDLHYDCPAGETMRVVETYVGGGECWTNVAVTATVADGGKVRRAVRLLQDGGVWTESVTGTVADAAHYGSVSMIGSAASVRSEYSLVLGDKAHAQVDGTMVAGGTQILDIIGRIRHEGVGGTSGQTWRMVAANRAQASFAGRIEVARGAQQTDANEDIKALLLDRTATVNAKPELEIFADDVKCAHGATVGELDPNALFYLASRGVPEDDAKTLLTEAFVADAFEAVENADLREMLGADARRALERVR
ncbi:MAG: SufD family Fe-S cluster assembly protein [Pacificimonas sp.]